LTSFSKKNFTSPSSESFIPSDFSMPRSPFSTAMKTERKCSKSDLEDRMQNQIELVGSISSLLVINDKT